MEVAAESCCWTENLKWIFRLCALYLYPHRDDHMTMPGYIDTKCIYILSSRSVLDSWSSLKNVSREEAATSGLPNAATNASF